MGHHAEAQPEAVTPGGRCFPHDGKARREKGGCGASTEESCLLQPGVVGLPCFRGLDGCHTRGTGVTRGGRVSHAEDRNSCLFRRLAIAVHSCDRKGLKDGGV